MISIINNIIKKKRASKISGRVEAIKSSPVFNSAAKGMYDILYKYDTKKR
jgi:hypothetical protein